MCRCMTSKFRRNFACQICERIIGEAVEQEEILSDDVEIVMEFFNI